MHDSKFLLLLRTLNHKEFLRFDKHITPFIEGEKLIHQTILKSCKKYYPNLSHEKLSKETLIVDCKLMGEEGDKKFRYAISDLTQWLEDFLLFQNILNNDNLRTMLLIDTYQERHLSKHTDQLIAKYKQQIESQSYRNGQYFFQSLILHEKAYQNLSPQQLRSNESNLEEYTLQLDIYYLSMKLKLTCEILNNQHLFALPIESHYWNELLPMLQKEPFVSIPLLQIYYCVLLTLIEKEEVNHYNHLKKLLIEFSSYFTKKELRDMYVYAVNYAIRKVNSGNALFYQELFEMYKQQEKLGLYKIEDYINEFNFKNVIMIALRVGELNWVEDFIADYQQYLDPEHKENAITYNNANLNYYRGNYDKALTLLSKVEFTDVYYHLDSKSLLLKVYFELDENDPFLSLVEAFRVYLKRNKKITERQILIYSNFINAISKLYRSKQQDYKNVKNLFDELQQTEGIADKIWFERKIAEVLNED